MSTNLPPPGPLSYEGQIVTPSIARTSSPTTANNGFPVPTIWINTALSKAWILVSKPQGVADWQPIGGGSEEVESMTVDAFTAPGTQPVTPNSSNSIVVTGGQVAAGTTVNAIQTNSLAANTYTIQIQRSQAVASSTVGDNGICHFNSADFSVDTNGFVSAASAGYARSVGVDAHTAPGTSPVLPTSGGLITVTGGQVAAGTTANVIRTDSLAANTYTVQVQRSTTAASSTVGDNGVCHFSSAQFGVDANGFVTILASGYIQSIVTQVFTSSGTYTPTSGMLYAQIEVCGGGGGGAASDNDSTNIYSIGGSGGAGGYSRGIFSAATIGASQTVTVGAGGAGGTSGGSGSSGGTTSVGSLISATGGGGNTVVKAAVSSNNYIGGGSGGSGSGGAVNIAGGFSEGGFIFSASSSNVLIRTGAGGSSYFGGGSVDIVLVSGIISSSAGQNGQAYGSGGSGGASVYNAANVNGGTGAGGVVIITEYVG